MTTGTCPILSFRRVAGGLRKPPRDISVTNFATVHLPELIGQAGGISAKLHCKKSHNPLNPPFIIGVVKNDN